MKNTIKSDEQALIDTNYTAIQWVGMSSVQLAIIDNEINIPATVDMFVDLKSGSRGIHMSRLYQIMIDYLANKKINLPNLKIILNKFIESQDGLSQQAKLKIDFKTLVASKSLKSELTGFRSYPVVIEAISNKNGFEIYNLKLEIMYSSTCPQSAKLSKEVFKNQLDTEKKLLEWYDSDRIFPATPHAQRSLMTVEIQTNLSTEIDIQKFIFMIENELQTAVQTAVKKADEMEFARLNSENTMFCEDSVRKIDSLLSKNLALSGYRITAEHFESLHSHNAYSQIAKNYKSN